MAFACSAGTVTNFEIGVDVSVGKSVIGYPDGNAAEILPVAPLGARSAIVLVVVHLGVRSITIFSCVQKLTHWSSR